MGIEIENGLGFGDGEEYFLYQLSNFKVLPKYKRPLLRRLDLIYDCHYEPGPR